MRNNRPDFLFTAALRFVTGAVSAGVLGALLYALLNRPAGGRPLLDWILGDQPHPYRLYYWLGVWSLAGGIIMLLTTRRSETSGDTSDPKDLRAWKDLAASGWDRSGKTIVKKSVSIRTVGADGEQHTYSSMDQVPPEIRSEIETLEKEAMGQKGDELSVTERSQTGNSTTSKIIQRKNVSVYKIMDESGVERVYHSLDEMPPEVRAAIAEAENQLKRGEGNS